MTDAIDRLLTDDGARWRDGLAPAPDAAVLLRGALADLGVRPSGARRPQWHRGLLIAAAALAAAGVSLGVAVISGGGGSGRPAAGGACEDRFTAAAASYSAADEEIAFRMTNRGARACVISAYGPVVQLRDAAGHLLGTAQHSTLELLVPDTISVPPGGQVEVGVRFGVPCPSAGRPVRTLVVHLSGGRGGAGAGVAVPVPDSDPQTCSTADERLSGYTRVSELGD